MIASQSLLQASKSVRLMLPNETRLSASLSSENFDSNGIITHPGRRDGALLAVPSSLRLLLQMHINTYRSASTSPPHPISPGHFT